jgi:hypothetical protein
LDYVFSSILTNEEKQYSEDIYNYDFDLNFFMNNLQEFYAFEKVIHIRIKFKKKPIDEVINLVKKLTENKENEKFVILIEVAKVVLKQIRNENFNDSKYYFKCNLKDHSLVITNIVVW